MLDRFQLGDALVDLESGRVERTDGEQKLTTTQVDILRCLADAHGDTVSRDDLLRAVWGFEDPPHTRAADIAISRLRAKLEQDPRNPRYLLTVRYVGYRLLRGNGPEEAELRIPRDLVGRDRELVELGSRLRTGAPVVLTGPAGVGKTRLARELCAGFEPPRVLWVELAGATRVGDLWERLAIALHITLPGSDAPLQQGRIREALRAGPAGLLVLDNAEGLADELTAPLSRLAGALAVLVTSRTPVAEHDEHALAPLDPAAASRLFGRRSPVASEGPAVDELVARLDHLPLAIELAAALSASLGPRELLALLGDRFELLRGQQGRWSGLREALLASWSPLDPAQQELLRDLALFEGAFDLRAVQGGLRADERPVAVALRLDELVRRSLVTSRDDGEGGRLFALLDSVRAFAAEQGAVPRTTRLAEAELLVDRAERARAELDGARAQAAHRSLRRWGRDLERVAGDPELDPDLRTRAAIARDGLLMLVGSTLGRRQALDRAPHEGVAGDLAGQLAVLRASVERLSGRPLPEVSLPADARPRTRARLLVEQSRALRGQGDLEACAAAAEQAAALGGDAPDRTTLDALNVLATARKAQGRLDEARALWEQTRAAAVRQGNLRFEGRSLLGLAQLAIRQGSPGDAVARLERAADRLRAVDARLDLARALGTHVQLACELGDPASAESLGVEVRSAFAELGIVQQRTIAEANHALVLLLLDRPADAVPLLHRAYEAAEGPAGAPVRIEAACRLTWGALLRDSVKAAERWLGEAERELAAAPELAHTFEWAALRLLVTGSAGGEPSTDSDREALALATRARAPVAGSQAGPVPPGSTARLAHLVLARRLAQLG